MKFGDVPYVLPKMEGHVEFVHVCSVRTVLVHYFRLAVILHGLSMP